MKWFNKLSLKKRLVFALLFFGIIPAVVVSIITVDNLKDVLVSNTKEKLDIVKHSKSQHLKGLFARMQSQVKGQAQSALTVQAMRDFKKAFKTYSSEFVNKPSKSEVISSIKDYYHNEFGKVYKESNGGNTPVGLDSFISQLSPTELMLQYSYISANTHPLGSKDALEKANDGTTWSSLHAKYHPTFRRFLSEFGYYDIFLVEPDTGHIVYSVFKELDFSTSLLTGPYSNTNFAEVFKKANQLTSPDQVAMVDLARYYPSYDAPAGFLASPIFDGNKKIGVLIFQIPVEKIDAVMTSENKWVESGFGESGEVYLVGPDKKMRSVSRFLIEDSEGYFALGDKLGMNDEDLAYVKNKNTTAITQAVDSEGVRNVVAGKTGFSMFEDYRGVNVFSSYQPVDIGGGVTWYILSEIDEAEALQLGTIRTVLGFVLGISILLVSLFSWYLANSVSSRMTSISERLKKTASATKSNSENLKGTSADVSQAATQQASAIQETVSTLNEITAMVNKSVEYAKKSSEKSEASQKVTKNGQKAVKDMSRSMEEIDKSNAAIMTAVVDSNQKISGIVKVIQEIAEKTNVINDIVFQTKLLSFNASVEAARAGEHGKGFAVVAEEVGNLAQMSGNAAREIGDMLSESIDKVESVVQQTGTEIQGLIDSGKSKVQTGVEVSQRCGEVFEEVVTNVSEVHSMMGEVLLAAREQAEGVNNISVAMNELEDATHTNSTSANRSSEYATDLAGEAVALEGAVTHLEYEIFGANAEVTHDDHGHHETTKVKSLDEARREKPAKQQTLNDEHKAKDEGMKIAVGSSELPSYDDPEFEDL